MTKNTKMCMVTISLAGQSSGILGHVCGAGQFGTGHVSGFGFFDGLNRSSDHIILFEGMLSIFNRLACLPALLANSLSLKRNFSASFCMSGNFRATAGGAHYKSL